MHIIYLKCFREAFSYCKRNIFPIILFTDTLLKMKKTSENALNVVITKFMNNFVLIFKL